ncbi:MAG: protease SohB [Francisellaceae bacterium]
MWTNAAIDYVFFLLEAITIIAAIVVGFALIVAVLAKGRLPRHGSLVIKALNKEYEKRKDQMLSNILPKAEYKKAMKAENKVKKAANRHKKEHKRIFVIDFDGDIRATQVEALSEEVNAILSVADTGDEVVIKLDSPGGVVNGYGLAAAQLARFRDSQIHLVAAVDQVAASGGYMMASVADQIIASPFAIVGSIGVVAQLPNFHRLLSNKGVDMELHTAGKYKRTLTMFGENTDEGRHKFQQELEEIHGLFKKHIETYRPSLNIEEVSTGEFWFGKTALSLNLVDHLMTSDEYLTNKYNAGDYDIFQVTWKMKKRPLLGLYHTALSLLSKRR